MLVAVKAGASGFVCKVYQGEGVDEYVDEVKLVWRRVKVVKPEASRKASREVYVVAMN